MILQALTVETSAGERITLPRRSEATRFAGSARFGWGSHWEELPHNEDENALREARAASTETGRLPGAGGVDGHFDGLAGGRRHRQSERVFPIISEEFSS